MRQRLESAQPYCYCATQDRGVPPAFPASNGTAGFGQAFPVQSNFELSTIITPNSGDLITEDALFDAISSPIITSPPPRRVSGTSSACAGTPHAKKTRDDMAVTRKDLGLEHMVSARLPIR
jgi:hypothetical protein